MSGRDSDQVKISLDMLQGFAALAQTLNVSEAAEELGVTRQTLRRYVSDLEVIKGGKLLELSKGRYVLTPLGSQSLRDANDFLRRAKGWDVRNNYSLRMVDGYEHAQYLDEDGKEYFSQQHSIGSVNKSGLPLMREMVRAWGASLTQLEHPEMELIRPYLVIYRRSRDGWICADVGDDSAYCRWFGQAWAQSAKGSLSEDDQVGDEFNSFISGAYSEIYSGGSIRLDHLFAHLPRDNSDSLVPVSFQRILAGCVFPNGQQALSVLVVITNQIEIDAMDGKMRPFLSQNLIMDGTKFDK